MASFEEERIMRFVSKAWNIIGVGARDILNVIVVLDHQFQEAHNKELTEM